MKKNILGAAAAVLLLGFLSCGTTSSNPANIINDGHNPRNSSDWAGIYVGIIPSAGGEGIDVKVILNVDETYTVEYRYIGKSNDIFTHTGTFTWNPEGNTVILDSEKEASLPPYYRVRENALLQLDLAGNIITGQFADDYILRKQK